MPIYKMPGKRDGLQKYRVRINYIDSSGTSRQIDRVAYGADEAKQLEMKLDNEIKHQDNAPLGRITIRELYEEYIKSKSFELRESSLDKSKRVLEYHVLPDLENVKLDKISLKVLQNWKNNMETKGLSLTTLKNVFGEFRALLNYAVKMEYIPKNPLSKLGNFKRFDDSGGEMDYYTADEFKLFISAARDYAVNGGEKGSKNRWDYYVFFSIAFFTGLRKGEIHALKWSDIKSGYLSVKRSITQKIKGGDRETPPKNKSSIRTLQLPAPLITVLDEHYKHSEESDGFNDDWRVCGGLKPLRDTSLQNMNKKFSQEAGLKTIRIHDFRHSHASLLANEGINIQEIARRLGHSKIEITWNTYSHLYPREEEKAVAVLNKII